MKKCAVMMVTAMIAVMLIAGGAWALPIDVSGLNLTELQSVFTGIGSDIVASGVGNDETQSEVFQFQSSGATATYVASVSWYEGYSLEFGIYDVLNPDSKLTLFNTGSSWPSPADDTQIYFQLISGVATAYTMDGGYNEIDSATFLSANLGFYVQSFDYNVGTYYSQSDLNANGDDRFLTYMGQGDYVDIDGNPDTFAQNDFAHWYIAAESGQYATSDLDFSDFVVQVESLQPAPVPEPGTMMLMGVGLLGLVAVTRRKMK